MQPVHASFQVIDGRVEGFDDARLDTLFLAMPISWRGRIAQYAGRLHRVHAGKREVRICDYADLNVPMLSRMFDRRCQGYRALGYSVLLPLKSMPRWNSRLAENGSVRMPKPEEA